MKYACPRILAAVTLLTRAVAARAVALGPDHWLTALTATNLAAARWASGDRAAAQALQARAMATFHAYFEANVDAADSDLVILDFLRSVRGPFDTSLALWGADDEAPAAFAQALAWQGAATSAESLWRDLRRLEAGASGAAATALSDWRRLRHERLTHPGAPPSATLAAVELRLTRELPAFAARRERLAPTVAAVCRQLATQRAALVDFVAFDGFDAMAHDDPRTPADERYTPAYAAFVIAPEGCHVHRVNIGLASTIDATIDALRGATGNAIDCVAKRGTSFCGPALAAVDATSRGVRAALWEPLGLAAETAPRVWIVPDGRVADVAFATLADAGGRYLVEDHELAYLPYPAALLAEASVRRTAGAWIGGDVNYRRAAAPAAGAAGAAVRAGGSGVCGYGATWPDLTPTEVTAIAGALGRDLRGGATLVTGAAVTEAAVRAALPGRRVIHLATHGFFSPAAACSEAQLPADKALDPLRLSAVALAGADGALQAPDLANDGILSAREVVDLDLRGTEVVSLSACETGLGVEVAGEGVQGLGRAFLVAGAKTVIVSLWRVPSDETGELFERFYRRAFGGARGPGVPAALRDGQLALLGRLREAGFAHSAPLWGAFIPMVGAGR